MKGLGKATTRDKLGQGACGVSVYGCGRVCVGGEATTCMQSACTTTRQVSQASVGSHFLRHRTQQTESREVTHCMLLVHAVTEGGGDISDRHRHTDRPRVGSGGGDDGLEAD